MKYKLIGRNDTFDLIEQIGKNRGVEDINALLSVSEDDLHSPWLLDGMKKAVKLVKKHLKKNSRVHIIVDADADGVTSATIIYLYLKKIGFKNITWNNHPKKIHGIILKELEDFNFDLLIVPDAGSDNLEEHKFFKDKGVDVLVLDHHECTSRSENAIVVNPKMCDYPNKEICGAIVVYKFCEAYDLDNDMDYANDFLDLVSIGTIADMMDSRNPETRYFCTAGLEAINNRMLKAIIDKQKFKMGEEVTIQGIQFYVAPLINSVFRSGSKEELDKMFTGFITTDYVEVDYQKNKTTILQVSLHDDTAREIGNIKTRQDRNKEKLLTPILEIAYSQNDDKIHIIDVSDVENPEMLGLLANDLASRQQRPVLLVKNVEGILKGSGRNYNRFEVTDLKSFLRPFGFESLEGHENAFGVTLKLENLDAIRERITDATKEITIEQTFFVDFILNSKDLTKRFIIELNKLKPFWGTGLEEPYILVKDVYCSDVEINEKRTMMSWTNKGIKYVIFNPTEKQQQNLLDKSVECDIIGRVGVNEWRGEFTEQFVISEIEVKWDKEKEMWF